MHTITVSFVLPGDLATSKDILALAKKIDSANVLHNKAVEVILYFSKMPAIVPRSSSVHLVYSPGAMPAIRKSIVVASGEKLVFTTAANLLADRENQILNQALTTEVEQIAAPLTRNLFGKLGMIRSTKTSYLIVAKKFVVQISDKFVSFTGLLASAPVYGSLLEIPQVNVAFPDHIVLSPALRPPTDQKPEVKNKAARIKPVKFSPDIPVFVICRDRVEPLIKLVEWCEEEGLVNIIFVDNASTYPPLLDYYSKTPYEVIRLAHNVGHTSPWRTGAVEVYAKNKPYIITDADIIPLPGSHGAVKLFCRLLSDHPDYVKAGFGLKIDDIPKYYEPRDYVIAWENQFWQKEVEKDVYEADIDTTFALCRQNTQHMYGPALRTGGKFIAKHDTWYINSEKLSEEMRYYRDHADKEIGTWGAGSNELPKLYVDHKNNKKPRSKKV